MRMRRTLTVCSLCLLLAPRAAFAEWHFTPVFGVTFAGNTTLLDVQHGTDKRHVNFGGIVSRFGNGVLGVEGIVIYTPGFFEFDGPRDPADPAVPPIDHSSTLSATGNVVLTVPKRWTEYFLRPYVSGGLGVLRAVSIDKPEPAGSTPVFPVRITMPGFTFGGGVIGFLSQRTGIRFDVRYHGGLQHVPPADVPNNGPDLHLRYMTAEIGVVIRR